MALSCTGADDTDDLDMQCTEEDDARPETPDGNPDQFVNTALAAQRFGIPYHVVCAIVNGFQRDIGRISESDHEGMVDPSKIFRARQRVRDAMALVAKEHGPIQALYFDGGQDESSIGKPTIRREEHVAVVAEPGSKYLTYFTPENGKTIRQAGQLLNIATDCDADVRALGCSGTAANTDRHSGVCRLFELSQEPPRAVHWFVCQLDANDLLLRAVLHYLDRLPAGAGSSGPLVETASGEVHRLGVTAFRAVPGPLPELSDQQVAELSSDQQILYRLARGVNDGKLLDDSDAHGEIGPVEDDRCLTLAARLLRVYIGTRSPTAELTELVEFLMGYYIPMWFHITANSACTSGALNVMRSIELLRKLPSGLHDVIGRMVQSNAYWAHPEAVLLAMVADPDAAVRARAVELIQRCRQQLQEEVRPFKLPKVNFAATHYTELLDWEKELVTEPPLTANLTDSELQDICDQPLRVAAFPVHTEGAKRAVRVVHQADRAVFGEERRHDKRHKSSHSPSLCGGRVSAEELSSDRAGSDEGSSAQESLAEPPADSFVVIEDAQDKTSEVAESEAGDELLSGQSLVIGQNEMLLLEMFVSRVVQEMETRYISRMLEMDSKVDGLTQLCSGMAERLEAALGPSGAQEAETDTDTDTEAPRRTSLPEIQQKMETLMHLCSGLAEKVDSLLVSSSHGRRPPVAETRQPARCWEGWPDTDSADPSVELLQNAGPIEPPVIALNRESEFPDGSWLGDPSNPRMRVRCKIHPLEMTRLSRHCLSAEKLAVTLLDHLFSRETLAESNISGRGKHCKKQLDPLMIYGIYCHLVAYHNVTEKEWQRIKKNLDAKCRSMWKRKQRGKPLGMGKYINKQQLAKRWCPDDPPMDHQSAPITTITSTAGTTATTSSASSLKSCAGGSPDLVFPDETSDGMVVMETMPVGDVVEVGHADYLSTMVELADFSSVKVIQTSMAEVRLLGGDSSDLLPSNNVSLHEASARSDTDRLQASSRQFRAVIKEEPIDEKQQRIVFGGVND
ncbi:Protein BANP [Amphibalanus amphitrite]|uniref:Protein BANP n=1 Tax=Amphibalanus amphitrite TaxID=1232801 RepID=A0A6A4WRY3_AMPAM|nr:Protein BANP [Amphibalanus amphitrite]